MPSHLREYFSILQELYKLNFKTIAWDANLVAKPAHGPINFFEIVFRKTDMAVCNHAEP